ncbi:MAG: hypothetical protein ACOX81_06405 [Candidatus Heteroscillospira sp.]|jgi:hypothetical protein
MRIIGKILFAAGLICLGVGVLLAGVAMLTGGGMDSIASHQIAIPYIERAVANVLSLLPLDQYGVSFVFPS